MNTSNPKSSSSHFIFLGGWKGIESAVLGSVIAAPIHLGLLFIFDTWRNGFKIFDQYFLITIVVFLGACILVSVLPAFISGGFLAWLLKQNYSAMAKGKLRLGTIIGAFTGIMLTLFFLLIADYVSKTAHGGFGYNLRSALPMYIFYATEIILVATIAGTWTDSQLRKQL